MESGCYYSLFFYMLCIQMVSKVDWISSQFGNLQQALCDNESILKLNFILRYSKFLIRSIL